MDNTGNDSTDNPLAIVPTDELIDRISQQRTDNSSGHGSRTRKTDWSINHDRSPSNDGRSHTRTTFYADTVDSRGPGQKHRDPENRRSWESLAKWNDGVQSDKSRGSQNWNADKYRWVETFAGHVDASKTQCDRTHYIMNTISLRPFQAAHIQTEAVILGALSLALNRDVRDIEHRAVKRDTFQELMDDLDVDRSDLVDIRNKIRDELD
jgi:hypothetical protein